MNQARAALAASHRSRALTRPGRPLLIAHRGSGHADNDPDGPPENTLSAVRYGFEQGADAVEVDVWRTADGVMVLHHDLTTDRTTGLAGFDIPGLQYADLRTASAGLWKHARWEAEYVPTLTDAVAEVPTGRTLVVEIEQGPEVVPECLAAVGEAPIIWISKNLDTAGAMKAASGHPVHWIVDTTPRWQLGGWGQGHRRGPDSERHGFDQQCDPSWLAEQALAHGLDGLDTMFAYPPELPRVLRDAGLRWMVWTVNDPRAIDQCLADGAWALTTDNTAEVRQWLDGERG